MKTLVVIPHFFRTRRDAASYGSEADATPRLRALLRCLEGLRQSFDAEAQGLLHGPSRSVLPANESFASSVDVVLCTTGDDHLAREIPAGLCEHVTTRADSRLLGYECHDVLSQRRALYDWFCYLEDDLLVADSLFFDKLTWFRSWAPAGALLQPNRFERHSTPKARKVYIDGVPAQTEMSAPFQDPTHEPELRNHFLRRELSFRKTENPHSGCFFLCAEQLSRWIEAPGFLDRSSDFAGPLESAATLGLMRAFDVYKPAPANASFLEVEHLDPRYAISEEGPDASARVSVRQR